MASLNSIDKMKFEKLLWMSSWYVIDFSNSTFADFLITNVWEEIYLKYNDTSYSKANRLRDIWNTENDEIVWKLLCRLLEYYKTYKLLNNKPFEWNEKELMEECFSIAKRLIWKIEQEQINDLPISYIDFFSPDKISELKNINNWNYDLSKLIRILEEVNICYKYNCYLAVSSLLRMLIDHIPPLFSCKNFAEVVSSYSFSQSDKKIMQHLLWCLKNISDWNLHWQISKKEFLPTKQTIDFKADFDVLLKNIILVVT
jgi:hypothetical protein